MMTSVSVPLTGAGAMGALTGPYAIQMFEVTGHFYAVSDPSLAANTDTPIMEPVNALALFTPRLPVGYQSFVDDYLVAAPSNGTQTISMIGNPVMGTWTATSPLNSNDVTPQMQYNIPPTGTTSLQSELAALPSIGAGNVLVAPGIEPQSYNVSFTGSLAHTTVPPITVQWTDMIDANGYETTVTVVTTNTGSPQITAPTSISIPPRQGRILDGILSTVDYVDSPGCQLVSNSPVLAIPAEWQPLTYDVLFTAATFNGGNQTLGNFAFVAPEDGTPVCITDPSLPKLQYHGPITTVWTPDGGVAAGSNVVSAVGWRERARNERVRLG
jgi:hypothetical protein